MNMQRMEQNRRTAGNAEESRETTPPADRRDDGETEMEADHVNATEDDIMAEIKIYKEEGRISHMETTRIVQDVKRLLDDTETKEKRYKNTDEGKHTGEKASAIE